MKRYETYKDSGIQWVGEIPSHWDVVKTSYLFDDIGSGTTPNTNDDSLYDTDNGINWLQTGDLNDGHITKTSKKISQKAIEGNGTLRLYPINSLVIALYGATIGKVGVLDIESTTNQACCVLPPSDKISTDFAYYIFLASKEALLNLASGGGQPNISQAIIKNHRIPYPSYAEQQSIVSFLEDKVGQIDATIAEKEQMLKELKAYRSAIISEAVTKGLDKNVEMKNSGIEWMGEIPSHWDIVKTSYLFDDIGSGTTPNTNDDSLYDADNGINWLQTGDLNDGHITKTSKKISQKAIEGNSTLRLYPINSLVIALYGATIGKVGVLDIETTTNQACCVLPPSDKVLTDYAYYVFIASKKALLNLAFGGGQPNISQAIIKNHRIPYPSYVEQQAITTYLDNKVEQIDKTLLELESQIHELKSYKSALITEAVTGKIDLREWKPQKENV